MSKGWNMKDAGRVLNVRPEKVPKAVESAYRTIAMLMIADPFATMIDLVAAMDEIKQKRFEERVLPRLERRQTGRLDQASRNGRVSRKALSGLR